MELGYVLGLHEHVQAARCGLVPAIRRTRSGGLYLIHDAEVFLLFTSLSGRRIDYRSIVDLKQTADGLARFHRAAEGYRPSIQYAPRILYGTWPSRLARRCRDLDRYYIMATTGGRVFDHIYLELWPSYRRQAQAALRLLRGRDYRVCADRARADGAICHHDLAYHNVLIDDAAVRFLDLDYAVADCILHDVVNLLGHVLRLWAWAYEPAETVLAGYWADAPLPPRTASVLTAMLIWPQDYWQIGCQFYDELQPWAEEEFIALLIRKCGGVEARCRFLRRFRRAHH